jgi:phosphatidylinositol glycan class A protein
MEFKQVPPNERLCICLVSDFFYPRMGGVELHQFCLAQGLIRLGHKVIVLTGSYEESNKNVKGVEDAPHLRQGIRFMTNGLKVYYCPVYAVHSQASLPLLYTLFPLFRNICLREKIQIVHGHQTTSALSHECLLHAKTMGLRTVYTDHSLFGFANAGCIHINKVMKFSLTEVSHVVAVSHCGKENIVLRACLDPLKVSVIPNAVDASKFTPDPSAAPDPRDRINVVILSRLVYRKGIDLAVECIPIICARFPKVHFIIGGDGEKMLAVLEMREKHQLQDRVEVLGAIQHAQVRDVLVLKNVPSP